MHLIMRLLQLSPQLLLLLSLLRKRLFHLLHCHDLPLQLLLQVGMPLLVLRTTDLTQLLNFLFSESVLLLQNLLVSNHLLNTQFELNQLLLHHDLIVTQLQIELRQLFTLSHPIQQFPIDPISLNLQLLDHLLSTHTIALISHFLLNNMIHIDLLLQQLHFNLNPVILLQQLINLRILPLQRLRHFHLILLRLTLQLIILNRLLLLLPLQLLKAHLQCLQLLLIQLHLRLQ